LKKQKEGNTYMEIYIGGMEILFKSIDEMNTEFIRRFILDYIESML